MEMDRAGGWEPVRRVTTVKGRTELLRGEGEEDGKGK